MIKYIVGAPVWLACSVLSAGLLNADLQWRCRNSWMSICNQYEAREHLWFSMGMSVAGPLSLFAAMILTGGGQHGFTFSETPAFISEQK